MTAGLSARRRDRFYLALCLALPPLWLWWVPFRGEILVPLDMLATAEPWNGDGGPTADPPWNVEITDAIWGLFPEAAWSDRSNASGSLLWNPLIVLGIPAAVTGGLYTNPIYRSPESRRR